MLRLILNLWVFVLGLIPLFWLTAPGVPEREVRLAAQPGAILLWGDSRTQDGIDVDYMSEKLQRPVVSFAMPGAGVYDFLLFSDRAPKNCDALVALSFPVFTREPNTAYNRTGLSLWALSLLLRHGVPLNEVFEIYMHNHAGGTSPVGSSHRALANAPAPIFHSFGYEDIAADTRILDYFQTRIDLMRIGVTHLLSKGCSVSMVEVPVAPELAKIRNATPYTSYADWVDDLGDQVVIHRPQPAAGGENLFHDLSHLNRRGQAWLTQDLVNRILEEARAK